MQTPFGTLYKHDSTGRVRQWLMEIDGEKYRTISGLVEGAQVTTEWTIATPKNVGKANETTPEQQALAEVEAIYVKKREQHGYGPTIEESGVAFFSPMLAKPFNQKAADKTEFPTISQPKLDGFRCIVRSDGMWSRFGKPILSSPHIMEALQPLFDENPEYVFDGELYNHEYCHNFNKISSLIKTKKPTPETMAETKEKVEYHIYDFGHDLEAGFIDRYTNGCEVLIPVLGDDSPIKVVSTSIVKSHDEIDELYGNYLGAGYEGQMIRKIDGTYKVGKRPADLLKRKEKIEMEFTIHDIREGLGNAAGIAKSVDVVTAHGISTVGVMGGDKLGKEVFENKDKYIGTIATVKFLRWTIDKVIYGGHVKMFHGHQREL